MAINYAEKYSPIVAEAFKLQSSDFDVWHSIRPFDTRDCCLVITKLHQLLPKRP